MPVYHFDLQTGTGILHDRLGMEFADDEAAHAHACVVARELMRHRERKSRHQRLCVRRDDGSFCCELLFATVDETLEILGADLRQSVIHTADNMATLSTVLCDLRRTTQQIRATLARADNKIHLAAVDGIRL